MASGTLITNATYNPTTKEYTIERLRTECFVDDLFDYNFFNPKLGFLGFSAAAAQVQIGYKTYRPSGSEAVLRGKVVLGAIWWHSFSENTDFDFSNNI